MLTKLPGRVEIVDDVAFGVGGGRELKCDVFTPPDDRRDRPGILLIHGGAWQSGDRRQLRGYGVQMARFGFVCVCAEYRLSGEAPWPAQIHDVKAALRWMRTSAADLGIDARRIAVSGNSAGAHLALMIAATPNVAKFEGEGGHAGFDTSCGAVVAIYPPTQLRSGLEGPVQRLFGGRTSRELEDAASPITYAHREFPPTLLIHGNADATVSVDASFSMYQALAAAGAPVELHVYDGAPHAFDAAPDFGRQVIDIMALFLDRKIVAPRGVELPGATQMQAASSRVG
jgi:acetyl esterase/lipase